VVHWAAKLLERAVPKIKFAALSDIVDEIKTRMVREVDFIEEAQNLDDFCGIFKYFPKPSCYCT
jgi:predicted unusual protein kinase regulating ubiquinone biosynthesis (AarF/ABC1/UbiB family)